jgi:hypothetical protein
MTPRLKLRTLPFRIRTKQEQGVKSPSAQHSSPGTIDRCSDMHYITTMTLIFSTNYLGMSAADPGQALFATASAPSIATSRHAGEMANDKLLPFLAELETAKWDAYPPISLAEYLPISPDDHLRASGIADTLEGWLLSADAVDQRSFWRFYRDAVAEDVRCASWTFPVGLLSKTVLQKRAQLRSYLLLENSHETCFRWDLSLRQIHTIVIELARSVAKNRNQENSSEQIFQDLREKLKQATNKAYRVSQKTEPSADPAFPTRRASVLIFVIHTGSSPPTAASMRPTVGWALVPGRQERSTGETWNYSVMRPRVRYMRRVFHDTCQLPRPLKHMLEYMRWSAPARCRMWQYLEKSCAWKMLAGLGSALKESGTLPSDGLRGWARITFGLNACRSTA